MRTVCIVVAAPAFDEHLRLVQRIEEFAVQQLIPEFPVKDSTYPFSHGLPGSMNRGATASSVYHACRARAMNSGPLSIRICVGPGLEVSRGNLFED